MGNTAEKIIAAIAVLIVAFTGGTAQHRPAAERPEMPAPVQVTASPAPAAETRAPAVQETAVPLPESTPEPEPTATPEPTPEPQPEYFYLSFVGDCTLASVPGLPGGYAEVVGNDYAYPFAKTVEYFRNDDFTFANLECSLTTSTAAAGKTFVFKAPPEYAKIMTEGSVEFVTLANNHVLDYGEKGYADTKAAVEAEGIAYVGRDEFGIYETDNGLKIGVYGVSFGTTTQIRAGIQALKDAGAEFIIAALHFGDEGSYQVNATQKSQAYSAIDAGADFVYGSHAHTLQPLEAYHDHLIVYCMGNWTFGGNTNPRDKDTFFLQMTVRRDPDGTVAVNDYTVVPCASSGETGRNNYQPVPYEEGSEGYQRVMDKLGGDFHGANLTIGYSYTANE